MDKTLKELFFESLDAFEAIETAKEPINSASVQQQIKRTIETFEKCTEQVSELDLFAANEQVDELETSTIPFLLLPALLGSLTLKLCDCEREHVVNVAETYFRDFLKRCALYGLCDYESKQTEDAGPVVVRQAATAAASSMAQMARCRQSKIARFKEKKQLQESLKSLKNLMESAKDRDEQIEREYYLSMVKSYIHQAVDDLESVEMEKPFIEFRRKQLKSQRTSSSVSDDDDNADDGERVLKHSLESRSVKEFAKKNSLNAVIIARNRAEKLVFGAGYPSLPVMSVEEFYEKRVRDGIFPGAGCQSSSGTKAPLSAEDERIIEESKLENDDAEMIAKLRLQDDYRDTHRRGWGNRYNRS